MRVDFFKFIEPYNEGIEQVLSKLIKGKSKEYVRQWRAKNVGQALLKDYKNQILSFDLSKILNTKTLKPVLPSIPSKYGGNEPLDLIISTSADIFREGADDVPLTGVDFGSDGTIAIHLNLHIDLRLKSSGKPIRHFYIPLEVKLKS